MPAWFQSPLSLRGARRAVGVFWLEQADQLVWTWLVRTSDASHGAQLHAEAMKSKSQQGAEATSLTSLGSASSGDLILTNLQPC